MKIKLKKLRSNAQVPTQGSPYSAGSDLYACLENSLEINPGQTVLIPTGIALELPEQTVGLVYARSGLASKHDLAPANKVGVIDCDYRGEIFVPLHNHGQQMQTVSDGMRIAQLVVMPYYSVVFEEIEMLSDSSRGEAGFGSTGKF